VLASSFANALLRICLLATFAPAKDAGNETARHIRLLYLMAVLNLGRIGAWEGR
jgi:hypothetical protein